MIQRGMPLEMADKDTLVALVTLADTATELSALVENLSSVIEAQRGQARSTPKVASWVVEPELVMTPREAFFSRTEKVAFKKAAGRVSAELVAPYPPGVPVLAPGEKITAETLEALLEAHREGLRIGYAADPDLLTLEVVKT